MSPAAALLIVSRPEVVLPAIPALLVPAIPRNLVWIGVPTVPIVTVPEPSVAALMPIVEAPLLFTVIVFVTLPVGAAVTVILPVSS